MKLFKSVTKILFITTQIFSLLWVSTSYFIALYSTVKLGQVFPVVELSEQAIITLLGNGFLKVIENIFEHNNGKLLGTSDSASITDTKVYEEESDDGLDI